LTPFFDFFPLNRRCRPFFFIISRPGVFFFFPPSQTLFLRAASLFPYLRRFLRIHLLPLLFRRQSRFPFSPPWRRAAVALSSDPSGWRDFFSFPQFPASFAPAVFFGMAFGVGGSLSSALLFDVLPFLMNTLLAAFFDHASSQLFGPRQALVSPRCMFCLFCSGGLSRRRRFFSARLPTGLADYLEHMQSFLLIALISPPQPMGGRSPDSAAPTSFFLPDSRRFCRPMMASVVAHALLPRVPPITRSRSYLFFSQRRPPLASFFLGAVARIPFEGHRGTPSFPAIFPALL